VVLLYSYYHGIDKNRLFVASGRDIALYTHGNTTSRDRVRVYRTRAVVTGGGRVSRTRPVRVGYKRVGMGVCWRVRVCRCVRVAYRIDVSARRVSMRPYQCRAASTLQHRIPICSRVQSVRFDSCGSIETLFHSDCSRSSWFFCVCRTSRRRRDRRKPFRSIEI
jgi:hypothetical protein